jgi:hypothetical protein
MLEPLQVDFPTANFEIKIVLAVPLSNGLLSTIGIRLGQQAYRVRNKVCVEYISGPDPPTKYVRRQDNLTVPSSQLLFSADRRCQ